jgi:hypothetical protein
MYDRVEELIEGSYEKAPLSLMPASSQVHVSLILMHVLVCICVIVCIYMYAFFLSLLRASSEMGMYDVRIWCFPVPCFCTYKHAYTHKYIRSLRTCKSRTGLLLSSILPLYNLEGKWYLRQLSRYVCTYAMLCARVVFVVVSYVEKQKRFWSLSWGYLCVCVCMCVLACLLAFVHAWT